ncbi:MAG: hypothetical protein Q8P28_01540 [Deltaproteobacteria bacterium]|nr:hypothetical protein [Deltaproteobacteria bacterium]
MSLMCPMQGCKEKQGMCGHEKVMLGLVGIIALVVLLVKFA